MTRKVYRVEIIAPEENSEQIADVLARSICDISNSYEGVTISLDDAPDKIFVGVIDHKHGTNLYAATTEEGLDAQLADYCREWWKSDGPGEAEEVAPPSSATDREIVEAYFNHQIEVGEEWYRTEEIELVDITGNPDPAEPLNAAERQALAELGPR